MGVLPGRRTLSRTIFDQTTGGARDDGKTQTRGTLGGSRVSINADLRALISGSLLGAELVAHRETFVATDDQRTEFSVVIHDEFEARRRVTDLVVPGLLSALQGATEPSLAKRIAAAAQLARLSGLRADIHARDALLERITYILDKRMTPEQILREIRTLIQTTALSPSIDEATDDDLPEPDADYDCD